MRILIVRNYPNYMAIGKNSTYNIQELGLASALVRAGHTCDIVFWTNDKEQSVIYQVPQSNGTVVVYYKRAKTFLKNAIYDIENYAETYWKDLEEANSAVVVSSPRLNNQKVDRIINMLGKRRELGVKVTIVTWHPDAYKYGKDDVRMELMERLRKAGFEIRLVEETCEHYAVIDNEIVWYGSVNLLSKEDAEDNLMRVCSKDIAAELLEMTFGSEAELQEW